VAGSRWSPARHTAPGDADGKRLDGDRHMGACMRLSNGQERFFRGFSPVPFRDEARNFLRAGREQRPLERWAWARRGWPWGPHKCGSRHPGSQRLGWPRRTRDPDRRIASTAGPRRRGIDGSHLPPFPERMEGLTPRIDGQAVRSRPGVSDPLRGKPCSWAGSKKSVRRTLRGVAAIRLG